MANTHARPGPILSGRTRSCKKSYTRKSDYAQWVGGVGGFGAKNPMKVFKKVGGFCGVFTSSNQFIHVVGLPASRFGLMAGQSVKIHKKRDGG